MNPLIQLKTVILPLLIALALGCFALLPTAQAVDPPPDGFYSIDNTAEGKDALFSLTSGAGNTAIGFAALYSDTIGGFNTATGYQALPFNTTGFHNTATGDSALEGNTTGNENTANGSRALLANTTGNENTANGSGALFANKTGSNNTANGSDALASNTIGINNTANGYHALVFNTTGDDNTANGLNALFGNSSGSENTANGHSALQSNTTGNDNTADGHDALFNNTTGSNNIAVGHGAGQNLTTGDNNIDIGNSGVAGEANTIRIGHPGFFVEPGVVVGGHTKTFIAGINGAAVGGGGAVRVNANGQLGTAPSSARFKQNIKPMDKASEAIHALKPVTFRYKHELDPEGIPQFGLVAEDVEKVNPDLVARDDKGKIYSVRYEAVNAMLLNEFLKEHRKNEEQEATIARQQKQIEALSAGLQKVSAQVEMSRPAPQTVVDNH
jgi:hypothetical protein